MSTRETGLSLDAALRAALTGTGLMALTPPGFTSSATATWSLGVELQFYAVLPVAILFLSKARLRSLVLGMICLVVAQQIYLFLIRPIPPALEWHYYVAPITFAPFFMAGFVIFRIGGPRIRAALPLSLIALVSLTTFSTLWPEPVGEAGAPFLLLSAIAMVAVYFANRATVPTALIPIATTLGELSYAVYLTHAFTNIATNIGARLIGVEGNWRIMIFVPLSLAVAGAVYFGFERPLRDRLRAKRKSNMPATLP